MNKNIYPIVLSLVVLLFSATSCNSQKDNGKMLKTSQDTLSWVIGENIARTINATEISYNKEVVMKAVEATLDGEPSPLNDSTFNRLLMQLSFLIEQAQKQSIELIGQEQDAQLQKMARENPKIKRDESGIFYQVLKEGTGPTPTRIQRIRFNYKGSLLDGTVFDNSFGGSGIQTLSANVMPGIAIALEMMNAGSHYIFYIPSRYAFGKDGNPEFGVPKNAIVVYELELYEIYKD